MSLTKNTEKVWTACLNKISKNFVIYRILKEYIWEPYRENRSIELDFNYYSQTSWAKNERTSTESSLENEISREDFGGLKSSFRADNKIQLKDFFFWGFFRNPLGLSGKEFAETIVKRFIQVCTRIEDKEKVSNMIDFEKANIAMILTASPIKDHISLFMYEQKQKPATNVFLRSKLCNETFTKLFDKNEPIMYAYTPKFVEGELKLRCSQKNSEVLKQQNLFSTSIENMMEKVGGEIDTSLKSGQTLFYRGQTNADYDLSPSVRRTEKLKKSESKIYHESLVRNPEEFNNINSHLGNLKKMQHYGVPTRLLDVTKSFGVALYFATESSVKNSKKTGLVRIFQPESNREKSFDSDNVRVLCAFAAISESLKKY